MRRLLSAFLAFALVLFGLPCYAYADEGGAYEVTGREELGQVSEGEAAQGVVGADSAEGDSASSSDSGDVSPVVSYSDSYIDLAASGVSPLSTTYRVSGGFSGGSSSGAFSSSGWRVTDTGHADNFRFLYGMLGYSVSGNGVVSTNGGGLLGVLIRLGVVLDDVNNVLYSSNDTLSYISSYAASVSTKLSSTNSYLSGMGAGGSGTSSVYYVLRDGLFNGSGGTRLTDVVTAVSGVSTRLESYFTGDSVSGSGTSTIYQVVRNGLFGDSGSRFADVVNAVNSLGSTYLSGVGAGGSGTGTVYHVLRDGLFNGSGGTRLTDVVTAVSDVSTRLQSYFTGDSVSGSGTSTIYQVVRNGLFGDSGSRFADVVNAVNSLGSTYLSGVGTGGSGTGTVYHVLRDGLFNGSGTSRLTDVVGALLDIDSRLLYSYDGLTFDIAELVWSVYRAVEAVDGSLAGIDHRLFYTHDGVTFDLAELVWSVFTSQEIGNGTLRGVLAALETLEVTANVSVDVEGETSQGIDLWGALIGVLSVAAIAASLATLTDTLEDSFPFGALFMVIAALSVLSASPVAPVFESELLGVPMTLDLSVYDGIAAVCRAMLLALYCFGLYQNTKSWIHRGGGDNS